MSRPDYPKIVDVALDELGVRNDEAHERQIVQYAMRLVGGTADPVSVQAELRGRRK